MIVGRNSVSKQCVFFFIFFYPFFSQNLTPCCEGTFAYITYIKRDNFIKCIMLVAKYISCNCIQF